MGHAEPDQLVTVTLADLNQVAAAAMEAVAYLKGSPDPAAWAHALDLPIGSRVGPFVVTGRLDGEGEHEARLALDGAAWQLVVVQRLVYEHGAWTPHLDTQAIVPATLVGRITLAWPGPGLASFLDARRGPERKAGTTALRALDHYAAGPVVAVDASWAQGALRDAVRAQLATWVLARATPGAAGDSAWSVTLSTDALTWRQDWARRVMRRRDPADAGDLLFVAGWALRAGSPAGHRAYWWAKLPRDRAGIMADALAMLAGAEQRPFGEDAADTLGAREGEMRLLGQPLGKTAAYARLRRAGKRAGEFATPAELATWLANHAPPPAKPPLAPGRREIVTTLLDEGWKREAARRLERRWRALPPGEQWRRLQEHLARRRAAPPDDSHVDSHSDG